MILLLTDWMLCTMQPGMSTDLVPFRIYHGNGEIRYGDSRVDLSEFQVFDTELNSLLDYSQKQVLAWLHEYLGVPPSHHRFRISMLVPKKQENGWRWELYEASNTKKWNFLVSKALERRYCNIMLVEFLDGGMQGESSNTGAVEDNLEAANAKHTYVCDD